MQQLTNWETTQDEARDALRTDIFAQVRAWACALLTRNQTSLTLT